MTSTFEQADLTATLRPDPDEHGECRRCHGDAEGCMCGTGSYYEMYAHDSMTIMCNLCGFETHNGPCPLHAPREIPGMRLLECEAVPQHGPTFICDGDPADYQPCPWCMWHEAVHRYDEREHEMHGAWRSSRLTKRVLSWLSRARLVTYTHQLHGACGLPGCCTHIRFCWGWWR